jgi:trehalose synthase
MGVEHIDVRVVPLERLSPLIGEERREALLALAAKASERLRGIRILNVNSTAAGGGVAELLQTLLAYGQGAGIDTRWAVITGSERYFEITKRIHNHLYGTVGDGGPLGRGEARDYEQIARRDADELFALIRANDIVMLHDPQTAPLVEPMRDAGARVVWRCHVGIDEQNEASEAAWDFLRPYIEPANAFVFSRAEFAPPWLPRDRLVVIAPSIDPFSAKNEPMDPELVTRTLRQVGLLTADGPGDPCEFTRRDGGRGVVTRHVDLVATATIPADVPLVVQASRWDALKDMPGVTLGFADHLVATTDAHLLLAGPEVSGVADDPEASGVLTACRELWEKLSARARERIHLACVPMSDTDEAAAIVNAIQRHATVVVQKSLAEGFGLTVSEAMWKSRAVVGSAVGGICDQIVDGESGVLLASATDLDAYGRAVGSLLNDAAETHRLGINARDRVRELFLPDRHLTQWAATFERLTA